MAILQIVYHQGKEQNWVRQEKIEGRNFDDNVDTRMTLKKGGGSLGKGDGGGDGGRGDGCCGAGVCVNQMTFE